MRRDFPPFRALIVSVILFSIPRVCLAQGNPDVNRDGKIDSQDVFLMAYYWKSWSFQADLVRDLEVNQHDFLELIRTFRNRTLPTATPTPTPLDRLSPPQWIHPRPENDGSAYCTYEVSYINPFTQESNDHFLWWTAVQNAGGYIYDLKVSVQGTPPPNLIPHVTYRIPTPKPGELGNHTDIHFMHLFPLDIQNKFYEVRVAALDKSPTPQLGQYSEPRFFWINICAQPTATPTPMIRPTYPIDFDGSQKVDGLDVFYYSKTWHRTQNEGTPPFNPMLDLNRDNRIDVHDLLLFMEDYNLQHQSFPRVRLRAPAYKHRITNTRLANEGLTFDWDPVPSILGGVAYELEILGPAKLANPPLAVPRITVYRNSYHGTFILSVDENWLFSDYYWRVRAVSPYGLRPPGPWSTYEGDPDPSYYLNYPYFRVTLTE